MLLSSYIENLKREYHEWTTTVVALYIVYVRRVLIRRLCECILEHAPNMYIYAMSTCTNTMVYYMHSRRAMHR